MGHSYWYFPGDPPIFDLMLDLGLLSLGPAVVAVIVGCRGLRRWQSYLFWIGAGGISAAAILIIPGAVIVAHRHGEAWSAVRSAIRQYSADISADVGTRPVPLSEDEFQALRARYLPEPVTIGLHGWGPVALRMA